MVYRQNSVIIQDSAAALLTGILTALQTSGHMAGALVFPWLGFRAGLHVPMIVAGAVLLANAAFGTIAVPLSSKIEG